MTGYAHCRAVRTPRAGSLLLLHRKTLLTPCLGPSERHVLVIKRLPTERDWSLHTGSGQLFSGCSSDG